MTQTPIIKKVAVLSVVGGSTLLDIEDYEYFKQWRWFKHSSGYIQRAKKINGFWKTIRLHLEILKPELGKQTDHINRDRTDNRRCNLRAVTASQNAHNRRIRTNNTSGVMGVWYRKETKKWTARITVEGKRKVLGCFSSMLDAAQAYKDAKELYVRY